HNLVSAVGSLVVRASDSRPEGLGSMPDATKHPPSTCSLNQWVRSPVGLITSAGTGEYFPPLQFTCRNCGGGHRGRAAIYRPFGVLRRAKIVLSPVRCLKANDRRTSCPCHDEFRGPQSDYIRKQKKII
ncbi:uncharacterized protein TNCV_819251, partial [Trichonephila clavipes]